MKEIYVVDDPMNGPAVTDQKIAAADFFKKFLSKRIELAEHPQVVSDIDEMTDLIIQSFGVPKRLVTGVKETMLAPRQEETLEDIYSGEYYRKLVYAYQNTYGRFVWKNGECVPVKPGIPCQTCRAGNVAKHATVWGEAICSDCYEAADHPCTQVYPGDRGFGIKLWVSPVEEVKDRFIKAGWDSIPEAEVPAEVKEENPFPRWQPVKCSCGWHGPAGKAIDWDGKQCCPKCWAKVEKHVSPKEI